MKKHLLFLALCAALFTSAASAATIIDKTPDAGAFWNPLGGSGTYVYGNSFVFGGGPIDTVNTLGIYLLSNSGTGNSLRFELWADSGNAPDPGAVLGVTNYFQASNTTLQLVTGSLLAPVTLTSGTRYWVMGSTVGQGSDGSNYTVGGHTQNSVYADNGTFWYSNDPAGVNFDGGPLTPEMAIFVGGDVSAVPEPSTWLTMAFGAMALGLVRRRRSGL